jgi:chemotaxis response regulator CheB
MPRGTPPHCNWLAACEKTFDACARATDSSSELYGASSVTTRHSPIRARTQQPRAAQKRAVGKGDANFPVTAIGASAGGLEAYRTLLAALPPKIGMEVTTTVAGG